jgi:hypothetical protein
VLITPDSAVSAVAIPPAPEGPGRRRPAPGAAGAGVTTGNNRARLPPGAGADRPGTVPRGNAVGRVIGPIRVDPAVPLPLWPGGAGSRCDGAGDGDLLGEGDGLGHGETFGQEAGPGEGDGLGHGDLLGEGDGLGEGDPLGDGDGDLDGDGLGDGEVLGDGDGAPLGEGLGAGDELLGDGDGAALAMLGEGDGDAPAAAPVLGRIASRMPAAIAAPPAMARAPGRGRADIRP